MFTINIFETVIRVETRSTKFFCFASSIRKYDTDDLINTYLKINYEAKANTEMFVYSNYDKGKLSLFIQCRHTGEKRYRSTQS
jgi:hypothetical protein